MSLLPLGSLRRSLISILLKAAVFAALVHILDARTFIVERREVPTSDPH